MAYESYYPFITKFTRCPCKLSKVESLLTPELLDFLFRSSSTSGKGSYSRNTIRLYVILITSVHPGSDEVVDVAGSYTCGFKAGGGTSEYRTSVVLLWIGSTCLAGACNGTFATTIQKVRNSAHYFGASFTLGTNSA